MKILILSLLLLSRIAYAGPLKVAIIDTGLNLQDSRFRGRLCATGHKDFTGEGIEDTDGHGTHIAGLIESYAGFGDYCLLIYKFFSDKNDGTKNLVNEIRAIKEAAKNGAKVINMSEGGPDFNKVEYLTIKKYSKILFVVAAGNEGKDLDIPGNEFYPASYKLSNIIPVENIDNSGNKVPSSNWGKRVRAKEDGYQVSSTLPCYTDDYNYEGCSGKMTGTSQSCAIHTGKIINFMLR